MLGDRVRLTSRSATFYGAPGAHEGMTVKVSTVKRFSYARQLSAVIKGTYHVYTESGEVLVPINIRSTVWTSEKDELTQLLVTARDGDTDAAERYLELMVSFHLDDLQAEGRL